VGDTQLNREVAIKVLPDHLSGNLELCERFEREARALDKKETARIFFNTRAAGVLIGIDQEVVTQRGPFG
jgi:hypothetical protein